MTPDNFVTWLIHSDWYLIGGWLLVLAIAVFVTFTDAACTLFRPRNSKAGRVPPEP